jgi:small-conductance mechanosensitive channel
MSFVAAAIGAAGAIGGALISSKSASKAASAQSGATDAAIAEQRRQYDLTREDFAPYRAAGTQALGQLQTDINRMPTSAEVMSEPGYQFGRQQGQQAIDRKIAAGGGRVSGQHARPRQPRAGLPAEHYNFLGSVTKWAIWIFAALAALFQLGIGATFIQTLFTGVIVALALAIGLSFGLGGRDAARDVAAPRRG